MEPKKGSSARKEGSSKRSEGSLALPLPRDLCPHECRIGACDQRGCFAEFRCPCGLRGCLGTIFECGSGSRK